MREVQVKYTCDYCGEEITKDEIVHILRPGCINMDDQVVHDPEESIRHYHDYCLEHLLCLTMEKEQELSKEEPEKEPEPEEAPRSKQRGRKPGIDVGKLRSLVDAGWKLDQIMLEDEFKNRDPSGIRKWIKKIKEEKDGGTK